MKLAKFHGAVGIDELRAGHGPEALCGVLAQAAGLQAGPEPTRPAALLPGFSWDRVRGADRPLRILRGGDGVRLAVY